MGVRFNPSEPGSGAATTKNLLPDQSLCVMVCSMNKNPPTSVDTDRLLTDRNGDPNADPAGDQAATGFGRGDGGDPARPKPRVALLARLTDLGVELAEELPALARAQSQLARAVTERLRTARPDGIAALGELAVTLHRGNVDFACMYERICRAVRRCIAMQEHYSLRRMVAAGARDAADAAASRTEQRSNAARANATGTESDLAADLACERKPERLLGDLYDRPEDPTGIADLGLERPAAEIVSEICADFGVDGRVWAEQLGVDIIDAPSASARKKQRSATGHERRDRAEAPPPAAALKAFPDLMPKVGTPAPVAGGASPPSVRDGQRHPPGRLDPARAGRSAGPVGSDHGSSGADWGSRNRRERRAALKLARKSSHPATRPTP
jgi:hypothetical protein